MLWDDNFDQLQRSLKSETSHSQFDVVLELSGASAAVETACKLADVGAHVILVGTVMPSPDIHLDPEQIVRRWLTIKGVHNYAPQDLVTAVEFLEQNHHAFPFEGLVEHRFPLGEIAAAMEFAERERPVRVAIDPVG